MSASSSSRFARAVPPGLTVVLIAGQPDDGRDPLLKNLANQLDGAVNYLRALGVSPRDAAILSLHSDSGTDDSHLANCYGGEVGGPSYQLGEVVMAAAQSAVYADRLVRLDYSYYMFYRRRGPYTAVLFECGSHQSTKDLVWLLDRQDRLAQGILAGALGWFGLGMPPMAEDRGDAANVFGFYGVPLNPDTAIAKYWLAAWRTGDTGNMGPALSPEESAGPYGLPTEDRIQRFANAIVHASAGEGWKCRRALVVQEPGRWFPVPGST